MRSVLLILVLMPLSVCAQDFYGAIAYSPRTEAHGWAFNHPSRNAAEKAALSHCKKLAPDCKTQVWFMNACAALATGDGGFGTAWGSLQKAADEEALKLCAKHAKGCSIVRQVCSDGKAAPEAATKSQRLPQKKTAQAPKKSDASKKTKAPKKSEAAKKTRATKKSEAAKKTEAPKNTEAGRELQ